MASPGTRTAPETDRAHRAPEPVPESKVRSLTPGGLIAGGAAAATASVIGGHLGVAGTMIGTFLTSVVSAAALALYSDSIARSHRALRSVGRAVQTLPLPARLDGGSTAVPAAEGRADANGTDDAGAASRRPLLLRVALLTIAMAAVGLLAVFGIQWAGGTELSDGTGTIQRSVAGDDAVAPRDPSPSPAPATDERTGTTDPATPATDRPSDPATSTNGVERTPDGGSSRDSGSSGGSSQDGGDGSGRSGTPQDGGTGTGSVGNVGNGAGSGSSDGTTSSGAPTTGDTIAGPAAGGASSSSTVADAVASGTSGDTSASGTSGVTSASGASGVTSASGSGGTAGRSAGLVDGGGSDRTS